MSHQPDPLKELYHQATDDALAVDPPDFETTWAAASSSPSSPGAVTFKGLHTAGGGPPVLAALLLILIVAAALLRPTAEAPRVEEPGTKPAAALAIAPTTIAPNTTEPTATEEDWDELARLADDIWSWQAPTDDFLLDETLDASSGNPG
ncbi:hypothetical protein EA187_13500 [Lujinxingia sediminis]|uniref:Uncharacterized protein n=1 Tax=Lujinxingia sediminis TaxID=2480984 RepID=A0ABY0CRL4_9DELT|nr:hypothetical protein [Lujinxingia sediminis]RVU43219.1 hypothetical protein EA187_13500 [Lujinxingia sediminis]